MADCHICLDGPCDEAHDIRVSLRADMRERLDRIFNPPVVAMPKQRNPVACISIAPPEFTRKEHKPYKTSYDLNPERILGCLRSGMSTFDIGESMSCTQSAVMKAIKRHKSDPSFAARYAEIRKEVMASPEWKRKIRYGKRGINAA